MIVQNTIYEGVHVYALLPNGKILKSPALDNSKCAEIHAEQVLRLQIDSDKLLSWYRWSEFTE